MVARQSLFSLVALIHRVAQPRPGVGAVIILLGLTSAVLEGLGLILFIPLIQSLGGTSGSASGVQRLLERLLLPIPEGQLTAWLVVMLCISILIKNLVNLLNTAVTRKMNGDVAHQLRARIFDQTLSSCIDYRVDTRRADISTTLSSNSWGVASALSLFYRMAVSLATFVVFIALMTGISTKLTLFAIAFLLLAAAIIRFTTRQADAIGKAVVEENKQFGLRMWESMNSLQLIRSFGRERYERERFVDASDLVRHRLLTLDLLWAIPGTVSEVVITTLIGALILTAHLSGIGIASLAAFLSLLYRLQIPTRELMQSKVALDGMTAAIEDVANLLDVSDVPFLVDGTKPAPALREGIVLDDVWFRYAPDEPWALKGVSLSIPAGKTTAIVGQSGAGKSTILALLFRFFDPDGGAIRADGVSISQFHIHGWRSQLALMAQEVQLFNDSILANIGYGRLGASHEDIVDAATIAHAHAFISNLPDGYETIVGDQGLRLSGGQRQRIALARAILRSPDILLLDEATNALDVEAEQAFQLALDRYSHKRTVVVIAHRLSTVQNADQVIVMNNGQVLEAGPPDRLIRDKGHFARILNLQQGYSPAAQELD
ncbi:ABC transporter ATP-binding protein [soil metagenome]